MSIGATSNHDSEVEHALKDTIDTIASHCLIRLHETVVHTVVLEAARDAWHCHYKQGYADAINAGHHWARDRKNVLERAKQVGYLAALTANIFAVFGESLRSGVATHPPRKGQDILLQPTAPPVIDTLCARAAACAIDCDRHDEERPLIWCPPPGKTWLEAVAEGLTRSAGQRQLLSAALHFFAESLSTAREARA